MSSRSFGKRDAHWTVPTIHVSRIRNKTTLLVSSGVSGSACAGGMVPFSCWLLLKIDAGKVEPLCRTLQTRCKRQNTRGPDTLKSQKNQASAAADSHLGCRRQSSRHMRLADTNSTLVRWDPQAYHRFCPFRQRLNFLAFSVYHPIPSLRDPACDLHRCACECFVPTLVQRV